MENLCHFLNHSSRKLKPFATCLHSHVFSLEAVQFFSFCLFTLSFRRPYVILSLVLWLPLFGFPRVSSSLLNFTIAKIISCSQALHKFCQSHQIQGQTANMCTRYRRRQHLWNFSHQEQVISKGLPTQDEKYYWKNVSHGMWFCSGK